nr:ribonuclease H-like domain, reverse transcriptase, RNA-dependent DNA polymerase [Tanacetum cinerariifolium]
NNNKDTLVDEEEHDDDIQKSVSPDIHSLSSDAQTRKKSDKTENKDKGKSPVVTITGFRDLNAKFEQCNNNSNDVGAKADINNMESIISKVWILVDLPYGKREIGTKWVYRNKKDERGIVIRNKARLVIQGHTQEEGIDYEEVFAPVARIEAIRLFLAYASFMGFLVYQMDVKSAFLYGTIEEEVYVCQPPGFEDPENPYKVYKVVKALYGLHQAPRAWSLGKSASTPIDAENPLLKESNVTPEVSHLNAVKRIFRYLKGKPYLGLWYPKDSPFDLVAYSDSDYAGASLDRKSTTGGCQFLRCRLISWQCKKQTVVVTSSTEAEYVAATSGCAQVMWIQNQLLDYGVLGFELTM